jgi:hypothetical protein
MSCDSIRPLLPMLLYGELSFDEEEAVDAHLDGCADCRKALERERELLATISQVAVEPSPALLYQCRNDLFARLQRENDAIAALPAPRKSFWARFVTALTPTPIVLRPAGAFAMLVVGFLGARIVPNLLPSLGGSGSYGAMSVADLGQGRVRSVEPVSDGTVRIVFDETRERTVNGRMDDDSIRNLLLAAAKDPSDGLRAEIVDLLTTRAQASDIRNALVYTVRNDRNAGVRLKALEGLKPFVGESEVRGALADVLSADSNPAMRIQAIDLLVQSLDGAAPESKQQQFVDPRMVGVLQQLISSQEENAYLRQRCQEALEMVKASAQVY